MSSHERNSGDLDQLLGAICDQAPTDDQMLALQQMIASDPSARRRYVEYMDMQASLMTYAGESMHAPTRDPGQSERDSQAHALQQLFDTAERDRRKRRSIRMWLGNRRSIRSGAQGIDGDPYRAWWTNHAVRAAVAAAIVVGIALFMVTGQKDGARSQFAVLARSVNARFADPQISNGSRMDARKLQLTEGVAQFDFSNGSQVLIEAPALFEIRGGDRVVLHGGVLSATVPQEGIGFVVETPGGSVRDLGTEFSVKVAPDTGVVETYVRKGKVEWNANNSAPVRLVSGDGIRIERSEDGSYRSNEKAVVDASLFMSLNEMNGLVQSGTAERAVVEPITLNNTGFNLAVGRADSAWAVRNVDADSSREAVVLAINEYFLPHDPLSSMWLTAPDHERSENSRFVFETRFDLAGFDPASVIIRGRFLVDDQLKSIRINGHMIKVPDHSQRNADDHRTCLLKFTDFTIHKGFVGGSNVIAFEVENEIDRMGLRVELRGTARRLLTNHSE